MSTVDEKKKAGFTRLLSWNAKRKFVSKNTTRKNTTWKPVSNDQYNFPNALCNSRNALCNFFIQIPFSYYDKSRILVHTALNLRKTEKSLFKCLWYKKNYFTYFKIHIALFLF